ncbi:MAG: isoprenylcysteine carboxylmethyltransferase family protein [Rhodospirillales bacterium]|jgi:protein-S-isoprenylcysteine O-methyltransferase Ste14|nr:isoprenylcysteine carboxylmethyltransferase family protein [Rhodospirillales bacterium]
MTETLPAYGLWTLVVLNAGIFLLFASSFFKPQSARDWRTFGTFSAFVVALFAEMYGFPLTIYLLSGWLQSRYPEADLLSHNTGHLWSTLFRTEGDPHFDFLHVLSSILIVIGFVLLAKSWRILLAAQRGHTLAMTGPYGWVRHPQYVAFISMMAGFLMLWPTLLTLIMFPILVAMYVRLAKREEREALRNFGEEYVRYARNVPAFIPRLGGIARQYR